MSRAVPGAGWASNFNPVSSWLVENDSGNLPAATVDEARAFKFWSRSARLLRKAGAELGVEIGSGSLNGF